EQPRDPAQGGGLPGAVGAEQGDDLAGGDGEGQVANDRRAIIGDAHLVELQHGRRARGAVLTASDGHRATPSRGKKCLTFHGTIPDRGAARASRPGAYVRSCHCRMPTLQGTSYCPGKVPPNHWLTRQLAPCRAVTSEHLMRL